MSIIRTHPYKITTILQTGQSEYLTDAIPQKWFVNKIFSIYISNKSNKDYGGL